MSDDAKDEIPVKFHEKYNRLCKILHNAMKLRPNQQVDVHFWSTKSGKPRIGTNMRIAEIGINTMLNGEARGGTAYMQMDIEASGLIFRCERYLLQCVEPDIAGPEIKEELEAVEWQLREYIKQEIMAASKK